MDLKRQCEPTEVRDPVYGFIALTSWERDIVDSPEFQRLRRIKQLGLTDMIYPGATHTRFEHSLGTMHLATKMYDAIIRVKSNRRVLKTKLNYRPKDLRRNRQLVRLAALLHDIGQMPFSHALEDFTGYRHEDYTYELIKGPLREKIENHEVNRKYEISADEVAALIKGEPKVLGREILWRDLISSQLDADRGDYLLRDSLHIGVKYGIYDLDRLLVTIGLGIEPESDNIVLGVKEKGWHVAESLVIARYQMFSQVYFHKSRQAYDYMLQQAIKAILKTIPPPNKIKEFLELDDYMLWNLIKNHQDDYWCRSIVKRNHLRAIYETKEIPNDEEIEKIKKLEEKLNSEGIWYLEKESKGSLYRLSQEIMIIDKNGKVSPLSEYSNVVKYLGEIRQIRIYVKPEDEKYCKQATNIIDRY